MGLLGSTNHLLHLIDVLVTGLVTNARPASRISAIQSTAIRHKFLVKSCDFTVFQVTQKVAIITFRLNVRTRFYKPACYDFRFGNLLAMARQSVHTSRSEKPTNKKRDPLATGARDAAMNRPASHNHFLLDKH